MSLILMTTLFYKALILQGEIWCWSLLGFKGLKSFSIAHQQNQDNWMGLLSSPELNPTIFQKVQLCRQ